MRKLTNRVCVYVAGGALTSAAVIIPALWPLGILGVAASLITFLRTSFWEAIWGGYLFGISSVGVSLLWLWLANPGLWLHTTTILTGFFVIVTGWLIYCMFLGLPFALWGGVSTSVWSQYRSYFWWVSVPLWVFCEWLRAFLFYFISWTPGFPFGAHGGLGLPATALAWSDGLLWLARFGGHWGLSCGLALLCVSFVYVVVMWDTRPRKARAAGLTILLVLIISALVPPAADVTLGAEQVRVGNVNFAMVHTNFTRAAILTTDEERRRVSRVADEVGRFVRAEEPPRVILLPEDSRFFVNVQTYLSEPEREGLLDQLRQSGAAVVDSGRLHGTEGVRNVIRVVDFKYSDSVVFYMQKTLLAPFGEYIPALFAYLWKGMGMSALLEYYERTTLYGLNAAPFLGEDHHFIIDGMRFGILSCSEIASPTMYHDVSRSADVLLGISSTARVGGSPILFNQMLALAKIHAVYAGMPYIQATNISPSILVVPASSSVSVSVIE